MPGKPCIASRSGHIRLRIGCYPVMNEKAQKSCDLLGLLVLLGRD